MRVLLIEPDSISGKLYAAALTRACHRVDWVVAAEQAIHMADANIPDVVVLSLEMARHNGVEFLYEFKSYSEWQSVAIILLINNPSHELSDNSVLRSQLGVHEVAVKSQTSLSRLCEIVQAVGVKAT